ASGGLPSGHSSPVSANRPKYIRQIHARRVPVTGNARLFATSAHEKRPERRNVGAAPQAPGGGRRLGPSKPLLPLNLRAGRRLAPGRELRGGASLLRRGRLPSGRAKSGGGAVSGWTVRICLSCPLRQSNSIRTALGGS